MMSLKGKTMDLPRVPLGTFMTEMCDQHGTKVALVDATTGRTMSYEQVASTVRRLARGLRNLGFKKGDVLCIFSHNVMEYPIVFYAVASLGGVLHATNPTYNATELKDTIEICKSKFVVTFPASLPTVRAAAGNVLKKIIVFGKAEGCTSFSSLISPDISDEPINDPDIDPENDVVAILFSSGTTGKPKGVQLTHYAMVSNVLQVLSSGELTKNDTYLVFLPFFHIYGLGPVISAGLYSGARSVIMSKFDIHEYLNNIQKYKATVLHVVPPVLVVMTNLPSISQYDLSFVQKIFCGAAPLSTDIEAKILVMFHLTYITQVYGMTEVQVTHLSHGGKHKFGSAGYVLPCAECKIVDVATGKPVPANVDGEVCLRSPSAMKGYKFNPGATAAMFDEDGWVKTGDIGHMDDEGILYIVDRLKELIKYKGFQVAPAELENVLLSHPAVADVGVVGVPDGEAGELPKAFIVTKPGSEVTGQELQDYVKSNVSVTKRLRGGVTFLSKIPKSPSGKILRRLLRQMD
ncbi:4-coumarate--CoA ligase 1-like [Haliotis rubra]|uniref:4-coumarate--CoA ligase 1-like n=1 Tax=Haliotis rubra TaxID=36100 RepID=UPI001EE609A8|nr:4-coumarate--CoA ligase 1-like [Haliotis rubra]XP_046579860.1 4-coumarate--CoA ligase 1-like [Haliotis rubra]